MIFNLKRKWKAKKRRKPNQGIKTKTANKRTKKFNKKTAGLEPKEEQRAKKKKERKE